MANVIGADDVRVNKPKNDRASYEALNKISPTAASQKLTQIAKAQSTIGAPKPTSSGSGGGSGSSKAAVASPLSGFGVYRGNTIGTDNPILKGIEELAAKFGNIDYDRTAIEKIFHDAAKAQFDADKVAKQQEIDNFTRSIGGAAQAMGQEMARARASGVMSGANTGMQAVDTLNAMTTFQQTTAEDSLVLQQELYQLEGEYNAAIAKGTEDALKYANEVKQAMATLAAELYGIDTQKYAAQLGYNAAVEEANIAASASKYSTDVGAQTARYTVDKQAAAASAAARASASAASRQAASYEKQARLQSATTIFNTSLANSNDPYAATQAYNMFIQAIKGA